MSTVMPNGQVRFLANVPLDDSYEDTIWFESKEAQESYFLSLTPVHIMMNATRVKDRDGVIAVNVAEDVIRECNYLMFQNMNFSNRWFYAFIEGTEYVNNSTTNVIFKLDPLQSYGNYITLLDCLVERETTTTDGMFEHLIDEGIKTSEYVKNNAVGGEYDLGTMDAIIFTGSDVVNIGTDDEAVVTAPCMAFQGFINGLSVRTFHVMDDNGYWDNDEISRLNEFVDAMTRNQQGESIVGGIMYPKNLLNVGSDNIPYPIEPRQVLINNYTTNASLDGYVPKNKKLYNSPYSMICLGSSDGQTQMLQPEFLSNDASVKIYSNISMSPSVMALVEGYKGKVENWETAISFNSFPQISMAIDGYKAWVASGGQDRLIAQTVTSVIGDSASLATSAFTTFGTLGLGLVADTTAKGLLTTKEGRAVTGGTNGMIGSLMSLVNDVNNAIVTMGVAKTLPPNIKGSVNTNVLMGYNKMSVFTEQRTINSDQAKAIDNYFTMYGYKVNKVKKPTLHNRSRFTYVKTKGCKITGGCPTEVIKAIEKIMDSGIRFWVDPSDIGNYTDPNVPLGN